MLPLLSAAELAQIQKDLQAYTLPDTAVILALTRVSDGAGGQTNAWNPSGTVPCRLDNKSGQRKAVATSLESFTEWMLTVPQSATLTTNNRVTVGGFTYTVKAVSDVGSWSACQRAQVERIHP